MISSVILMNYGFFVSVYLTLFKIVCGLHVDKFISLSEIVFRALEIPRPWKLVMRTVCS